MWASTFSAFYSLSFFFSASTSSKSMVNLGMGCAVRREGETEPADTAAAAGRSAAPPGFTFFSVMIVFSYLQDVIINTYLQWNQLDVLIFPLIAHCTFWKACTTLSLKIS